PVQVHIGDGVASLTSGSLTARVRTEGSWQVEFVDETGRVLTSSIDRSVGIVSVADDGPYVCEQLTMGVAERVYGLVELVGPLVKNGQSVDSWHPDGGTTSHRA